MKLTNDPHQAPTIWHYTPFLLSVFALAFSLFVVGFNLWAWFT